MCLTDQSCVTLDLERKHKNCAGEISFPCHALEVGQYQVGQIAAVTALQQAEHRHAKRVQRLAEPVIILHFEHALHEGIAHIGIESSGHGNKVGPELFQIAQRPGERRAISFARIIRRDGIIETILADIRRAGAGIKRIQVD